MQDEKTKMPAKNLTRINDEGTFSHIYNKGIENRVIFNDDEDYAVFLGFIKDYLSPQQDLESVRKEFKVNGKVFRGVPHQPKNYFNQVELLAYSLHADHFHLVLHQKTGGALERFVRSLCTRYSIYFNKKYQRTGTLFQGPYKSAHVKDELALLYLTRYLHLHSSGDYSSYPEYLGINQTLPVNTAIVLSNLKKGKDDYKIFVEKYQLFPYEQESLQRITIEPISDDLERTHLTSKPAESVVETTKEQEIAPPKEVTNPRPVRDEFIKKAGLKEEADAPLPQKPSRFQRMPEIFASIIIFALLTAIGVTNISVSKAKGSPMLAFLPSPSPAVLADTTKATLGVKVEVTAATPAAEEKPKQMVTVKLDDGSSSVNIRKKPTSYSEKIGSAKDGDTFEYINLDAGWYEVKLDDGSTGFILATYLKKEEK